VSDIQEAIRTRYADKAVQMAKTLGSCCETDSAGACCDAGSQITCGDTYSADELKSLGLDAGASLGCGNPTLLADLHAGETVLDLGSGAGVDVLLSARRVSPGGHAYGVDMTDEMLAVARANQDKAQVANATFVKGTIEAVPLPDASVDVIISNCVINLAADKNAVLNEAFRLLKPGGRLAVADMIALEELSPAAKKRLDLWAGCIAGTISSDAYVAALGGAGFEEIDVETTRALGFPGVGRIASAYIRARKPAV
jgi:arsenite methyltransferase